MLNFVKCLSSLSSSRRIPITKSDYLTFLTKQRPESPHDSKILKIAVLGCPNSGKSSLVNILSEWRACGVSGKSHTTRSKQNVIYTQDNVQLVFVDLPGLVRPNNYFAHKYEKSIVTDPHSAIFHSDLILVVVDVTHKESRYALDKEVIKALHFFKDKDSILVLNKIDSLGEAQVELLRITRLLTDGIVAGKCSHLDAFHDRKMRRLALAEVNSPMIVEPRNLIFERLPECAHDAANRYIDQINLLIGQKKIHDISHYVPSLTSSNQETLAITGNSEDKDLACLDEHTEIILNNIEDQMMLRSATKEEVAERRHAWLTLSRTLDRIESWRGFSDVFMVSSLTGQGVANLRNSLLQRSKSGLWAYHPQLVSDQEPSRIIKMAFWTHALDYLPKEIYNKLKIRVNDCELVENPENPNVSQKIFCHIEILCETERQIKQILGFDARKIKNLSSMIENELALYFDSRTTVKISLLRKGIPGHIRSSLGKVDNFESVFPHYEDGLNEEEIDD